jgi:hypothetical protein
VSRKVPQLSPHEIIGCFHFLRDIFIDLEQGRVVGVMTRLRAGQPRNHGSIPGRVTGFLLLQNVHTGSETHADSLNGHWGFFTRGLKQSGPEANHSPLISSEVKNEGSYAIERILEDTVL